MEPTETATATKRIVVVGGSFAGLGAAFTLRQRLPADCRVTLISPSSTFVFAPSSIWTAFGRSTSRNTFLLDSVLRRKGIEFVRSYVREVRPDAHVVRTDDGEISYDRLIIATGGRPDSSSIPGLAGEFRAAHWIVGEESALDLRMTLERLYEKPGPLVIGAAAGAAYLSAAYELTLALDAELRRRGLRERVPITFVTAEPYLGHLGLDQTEARHEIEKLFNERGIVSKTGVNIHRVDTDVVVLSTGERLAAQASFIMPPFTGAIDIWKSAGLTNASGLIPVNERYQHAGFSDIYAAGVAATFEHAVPPLSSTILPQTAYLSLRMGRMAGENAAASLGYGEPANRTLPRLLDVRVLDGDTVGVLLTTRVKNRVRNRALRLPGRSAHFLKLAIERYLLWRLQSGRMALP